LIATDGWSVAPLAKSSEAKILPYSPAEAARLLFGVPTESSMFAERCKVIDSGILPQFIEDNELCYKGYEVLDECLGVRPSDPIVSILIRLCRRFDTLESQILEFARDEFIRRNVEVVYVIDDPDIIDDVRVLARKVHKLTNFPLRLVWNGTNGGFSLANNLAAAHSRGRLLLFLSSEVIPVSPSWLETLVGTIQSASQIGAVGARLVLPNGGLQHAGMRLSYDRDLSVWRSRHPFKGIDPSLLDQTGPFGVLALTSACILMQRRVFESIGGWDTGYLIGDFADSDLCFKLLSRGMSCYLDPRSTLIHLERDSFEDKRNKSYRQKITVYNAVRHQTKWSSLIEGLDDSSVL
jgi:GT2 family glycosyltransferase